MARPASTPIRGGRSRRARHLWPGRGSRVDVPDLTLIAARNDGDFDAARIVQLIDGRDGLAAHGGPMPMFGGLLTGPSVVLDAKDGSPVSTTAPILELVRWLETLQREAAEEGAQ